MTTTKQKILSQIKNSLLLNEELKEILKKIVLRLNEQELWELLKKLQTEEELIKNFLTKIIKTKKDSKNFEKLFQKTKRKMYKEEERKESVEINPESLLKTL